MALLVWTRSIRNVFVMLKLSNLEMGIIVANGVLNDSTLGGLRFYFGRPLGSVGTRNSAVEHACRNPTCVEDARVSTMIM